MKSEKAREILGRFPPGTPNLKLARILYDENKVLFKDVEDARGRIRYVTGKDGNKNRRKVKDTSYYQPEAKPYNPYSLPKSEESDYSGYKIKGKRIGIFSDIHVPFHNIDALTCGITFFKKEKIDALLLNGDSIDCYKLSRFAKDPKQRDFKYELDTFKALFEVFEKQLKCKIYFKLGNHEERYEKFLFEKAGELSGIEEFQFENIIKARARGIEVISDKRYLTLNSLTGIHGHEYIGGSAPVNPARGLFNKGKVSCFQGHNHQTSEHTEPTLTGKIITTWSIGCMCELHPQYMPLNKWNHGLAVVDLDSNGEEFEFRNKRIKDGKLL